MRVESVAQYLAHVPYQYDYPHGFQSARGRDRHATAQRQDNKDVRHWNPPSRGVGHQRPRGSQDADGLHNAAPNGIAYSEPHLSSKSHGNKNHCHTVDAQIEP